MSENNNCGWAIGVGFLIGIAAALAFLVLVFTGFNADVGRKYQECVALGAPADNCLKEYVLPDNQKGE